jgi:hypothetical protein
LPNKYERLARGNLGRARARAGTSRGAKQAEGEMEVEGPSSSRAIPSSSAAVPGSSERVNTVAAHRKRLEARRLRARASDPDEDYWRSMVDKRHAETMEREAEAALALPEAPVRGTGGEFVPQGVALAEKPGIVALVRDPDWTHLHASEERIDLAAGARAFDLAAATADDVGAQNDTERMLTHQLAASHVAAMRCFESMYNEREKADRHPSLDARAKLLGESARFGQLAARFMDTYQRGLQTLAKLRTGNRQTVTVIHQHVMVAGGQVAVAGAVNPGGGQGSSVE